MQRFDKGDSAVAICRLYDRNSPTLYKAEAGEVGEVGDVSNHQGEWLLTVSFGLCVVVANQRCFDYP
jgi:hypothetical protein